MLMKLVKVELIVIIYKLILITLYTTVMIYHKWYQVMHGNLKIILCYILSLVNPTFDAEIAFFTTNVYWFKISQSSLLVTHNLYWCWILKKSNWTIPSRHN